jgi:hypothetical protein
MRGRVALLLWLAIGVAVWNGFNDLYVSRGAREYRELLAKHQLGRGPNPDMTGVMLNAQRDGVIAASMWAALVTGAGLATYYWAKRSKP